MHSLRNIEQFENRRGDNFDFRNRKNDAADTQPTNNNIYLLIINIILLSLWHTDKIKTTCQFCLDVLYYGFPYWILLDFILRKSLHFLNCCCLVQI